jgi:hypothetical protein
MVGQNSFPIKLLGNILFHYGMSIVAYIIKSIFYRLYSVYTWPYNTSIEKNQSGAAVVGHDCNPGYLGDR